MTRTRGTRCPTIPPRIGSYETLDRLGVQAGLDPEDLGFLRIDELKEGNATGRLLDLKDLHVFVFVEERGGVELPGGRRTSWFLKPPSMESTVSGSTGEMIVPVKTAPPLKCPGFQPRVYFT